MIEPKTTHEEIGEKSIEEKAPNTVRTEDNSAIARNEVNNSGELIKWFKNLVDSMDLATSKVSQAIKGNKEPKIEVKNELKERSLTKVQDSASSERQCLYRDMLLRNLPLQGFFTSDDTSAQDLASAGDFT